MKTNAKIKNDIDQTNCAINILRKGSADEKALLNFLIQEQRMSPGDALEAIDSYRIYKEDVVNTSKCIKNCEFTDFDNEVIKIWREKYNDTIYSIEYVYSVFNTVVQLFTKKSELQAPQSFFETPLCNNVETYVTDLVIHLCPYVDFYRQIDEDVENQVDDIYDSNCPNILDTIASEDWGHFEHKLIQYAYDKYVDTLGFEEDDFCEMLAINQNKLKKILDSTYSPLTDSEKELINSQLSKPNPFSDWLDYIQEDSNAQSSTHYNEFCERFKFDPDFCNWNHWSYEVITKAIDVYVDKLVPDCLDEFANKLGIYADELYDFAIDLGIIDDDSIIDDGELLLELLEEYNAFPLF